MFSLIISEGENLGFAVCHATLFVGPVSLVAL